MCFLFVFGHQNSVVLITLYRAAVTLFGVDLFVWRNSGLTTEGGSDYVRCKCSVHQ